MTIVLCSVAMSRVHGVEAEGLVPGIAPAGSGSKSEAPKLMFRRLNVIPIWQSLWREDQNIPIWIIQKGLILGVGSCNMSMK